MKKVDSVQVSDGVRRRLNYRLKRQLAKYGLDENFADNASIEAKILMLGITLLWDHPNPKHKLKFKEPDVCPKCGVNTFRLDVHLRKHQNTIKENTKHGDL